MALAVSIVSACHVGPEITRLLHRPVTEYGTLCHGDGSHAGVTAAGGG